MQSRLHSTVTDTQVLGDLVIAPVLCILEQQQFRVASGQSLDGHPNQPPTLLGQQPIERFGRMGVPAGGGLVPRVSIREFPLPSSLASV
jgi:hypothetical protein